MRSTLPAIHVFAIAFVSLLSVALADGRTWKSEPLGISVEMPKDWKSAHAASHNVKRAVTNRAATKTISMAIYDANPPQTSKLDWFESYYLESKSAKKIKGGEFAVDGQPGYRFVAESTSGDKKTSHVVVTVVHGEFAYALLATSQDRDADTDSEINACISSWRVSNATAPSGSLGAPPGSAVDPALGGSPNQLVQSPAPVGSAAKPTSNPTTRSDSAKASSVYTSQEDRFSITLPNGDWVRKDAPDPRAKYLAARRDGTKLVVMAVVPLTGPANPADPGFQEGLDRGFLKPVNGTKIRGTTQNVEGRPCYRLVAEGMLGGVKVSHLVLVVISHGKAYSLNGQSRVGDADADPEINAAINSFHLLDPPDPANSSNAPLDDRFSAHNISKAAGGIAGLALLTLLVVFIVKKASGN